jgi:hypothetical protein
LFWQFDNDVILLSHPFFFIATQKESKMSHKIFHLVSSLFLVLAVLGSGLHTQVARAAGPWYVTPTGDDNNDCLSPGTACATINGAIGKASSGDAVNVAAGTYTGTSSEVVLIDRDITLSGGWDSTFSTQSGMSMIDGQASLRGITMNSGATAIVEHFTVQNGSAINGGGITNNGNLTLNVSAVSDNTTTNNTYGGGIYNAGILTVNNSTIKGNIGDYQGGGIYNSGALILTNSTVSNNSLTYYTGEGGGIKNGGTLLLSNSTVSSNTALGGRGGGISNDGDATINNSTITGNNTAEGGGISNLYGVSLVLRNSIVAGNTAVNGPDCYDNSDYGGLISSMGYNLVGNTTLCPFTASIGDLTNVDPNLDPLQNNGGPTFTHALLPSSPAIDTGNPAGCKDQNDNLLTTDQRGVARPQGARCDMGAFELEADGGGSGEVTIDIKPGNQTNPINPRSSGKTPVAILSTPDFNAPLDVDRTSLTFGRTGDELSLVSCNRRGEDVNGDGLRDLVCHFKTKLTGFNFGDTEGILRGLTLGGVSIEARDVVRVLHASYP